jgi:hypothetical protein
MNWQRPSRFSWRRGKAVPTLRFPPCRKRPSSRGQRPYPQARALASSCNWGPEWAPPWWGARQPADAWKSALGSLQSHWQGRIGFAGQTARQTALAPGQVAWRHSMATLSLVWRTLNPSWLVSADIGPLLGFATLSGQGFAVNQQENSFEFGLEAGLRAGRRWRRFTLWVDLRGESWRQQQRAVVTGAAPLALAPWDLAATLGLSVSLFP